MDPTKPTHFEEKDLVKALKEKPIELRKAGISTDPVLELGLLLDCTSSMSSWIQKAKETLK